jgi:hypothetical protein
MLRHFLGDNLWDQNVVEIKNQLHPSPVNIELRVKKIAHLRFILAGAHHYFHPRSATDQHA